MLAAEDVVATQQGSAPRLWPPTSEAQRFGMHKEAPSGHYWQGVTRVYPNADKTTTTTTTYHSQPGRRLNRSPRDTYDGPTTEEAYDEDNAEVSPAPGPIL